MSPDGFQVAPMDSMGLDRLMGSNNPMSPNSPDGLPIAPIAPTNPQMGSDNLSPPAAR